MLRFDIFCYDEYSLLGVEDQSMNVSLTRKLEKFVHDKVKSGQFASASEVVREGLRRIAADDEARHLEIERLKRELQIGLDQLDRGDTVPGEVAFSQARKRIAEIKAAKLARKRDAK
jgi:antitoxin ParD1/3/4